jgi:hypothetical protein
MAKISAHGIEIGTIEYTSKAKRYMSDGVILVNIGFGWKIYGKIKDGATPNAAFQVAKEKQRILLAGRPAFSAYRKLLHDMAGLSKRWKLHAAVELLHDDPDGVWSEACDGYSDNVHADLDEVCELCRAYQAAITEARDGKKEGE